jgi:hypothetical protein
MHDAQAMSYSSRLDSFATQHWSHSSQKAMREEDVEAAAEEPLLGHDDSECASPRFLLQECTSYDCWTGYAGLLFAWHGMFNDDATLHSSTC